MWNNADLTHAHCALSWYTCTYCEKWNQACACLEEFHSHRHTDTHTHRCVWLESQGNSKMFRIDLINGTIIQSKLSSAQLIRDESFSKLLLIFMLCCSLVLLLSPSIASFYWSLYFSSPLHLTSISSSPLCLTFFTTFVLFPLISLSLFLLHFFFS